MIQQWVSDTPQIKRKQALIRTSAPYDYGSYKYDEIDAQTCIEDIEVS